MNSPTVTKHATPTKTPKNTGHPQQPGAEKKSEWGVELNVYIPTYFDNRSRLYIEATRHGKTLYEHFEYLETEDGGSGPRTLRIPTNVADDVKARVRFDLFGDKRLVMPLG